MPTTIQPYATCNPKRSAPLIRADVGCWTHVAVGVWGHRDTRVNQWGILCMCACVIVCMCVCMWV